MMEPKVRLMPATTKTPASPLLRSQPKKRAHASGAMMCESPMTSALTSTKTWIARSTAQLRSGGGSRPSLCSMRSNDVMAVQCSQPGSDRTLAL